MNRFLYAGDCLDILNDTTKLPTGSIDLIYLDPPFNSNSTYNLPFKSRDRSLKPVQAFEDTWSWSFGDDQRLTDLERNPQTRPLATVVKFAREMDGGKTRQRNSLAAYILNMALRLYPMKRVLKETGSIFLHCDPTASHYLKLLMDGIFGRKNFRNEIAWCYRTGGATKRYFARKHDILLCYGKGNSTYFQVPKDRSYLTGQMGHVSDKTIYEDEFGLYQNIIFSQTHIKLYRDERGYYTMVNARDYWDIDAVGRTSQERLGYPTQKPLALLERIVKSSCPPDGIVLDPFCGCGTTVHAAEALGRKWIGIDISKFSTGLIRRRIVDNFGYLNRDDILIHGTPESVSEARALAQHDKFEFEKWVCGALDANGMYKNPGERGADGGVDGVVELPVIRAVGNKYVSETEYVIIQVKGGNVAPDSVKALSETVRRLGAIAGIMVCFRDQIGTVENQRSKDTWSDAYKQYPVIQGFAIEDMLSGVRPNLPPTWGLKHGGKTSAIGLL